MCAPLLTCLGSGKFLYSYITPLPREWCRQQWTGSSHIRKLKATPHKIGHKTTQCSHSLKLSLQVILGFVKLTKLAITDTTPIYQSSLLIVNRDCSFAPGFPDPNNHTGTILIAALFGLLSQFSY